MSAAPQRRVNTACQRCRKQKLRCDDERPCTLCTRAGVDCVPRRASGPRARKSRKLSHPQEGEIVFASRVPPDASAAAANGDDANGTGTGSDSPTEVVTESGEPTWLDVANKILEGQNDPLDARRPSFALPGSGFNQEKADEAGFDVVSIATAIDFELPPRPELDSLVDAYFTSSPWFMILMYEPRFRSRYVHAFDTGYIAKSDLNFLKLCFMVFSIGARVVALSSGDVETAAKYNTYRKMLMRHVELTFIQMLDASDLCAVQTCILLGSCLTYEGNPRSGYTVLGTGVAVARAIGLYQENNEKKRIHRHVLEDRRRTFYALLTVDQFDAVKTGRPPGINLAQVDVTYPADIGDLKTPPGLPSLMEYHHQKFALYKMVSPALQSHPKKSSIDLVKSISKQAKEWESKLPPHLQWNQQTEMQCSPDLEAHELYVRQLRWQALALHTTYNNLMIILHRPYMTNAVNGRADMSRASQARTSRRTIFDVALRMSNLKTRFPQAMADLSVTTHAATLCGIGLFTAGVVLSCVALANPGSNQAHSAKGGIQRIIGVHTSPGSSHVVMSVQSAAILRDLVRFIMEKETAFLLSPDDNKASTAARLPKQDLSLAPNVVASPQRYMSPSGTKRDHLHGDVDAFSHGSDTSADFDELLNENLAYGESLNDVWQLFSRYDGPTLNQLGQEDGMGGMGGMTSTMDLSSDALAMPPPMSPSVREPFDMAQSWLWWNE